MAGAEIAAVMDEAAAEEREAAEGGGGAMGTQEVSNASEVSPERKLCRALSRLDNEY